MRYFDYATNLRMTNDQFHELFDGPPRKPETPLTQREMDIARSVQAVTELVVLRLARTIRRELDERYLCLAGGVALSCVANGRLLRERIFDQIWIQPAAGDSGGALGAAYATWHQYLGSPRNTCADTGDRMAGSYLGPSFRDDAIASELQDLGARFDRVPSSDLEGRVAGLLADGHIVGWFQGRMEYGPRALGARSILGDPRRPAMQSIMNQKIKFRESFRPFAPAVLEEDAQAFFELDQPSPYMLIVAPVHPERRVPVEPHQRELFGVEKLKVARSTIPAVTHVDYSARVQTVSARSNPRFHRLLSAFKALTGCPMLVNTSFNVRGEPIVCTVTDAYRCFMRTNIDYLVCGDLLLAKADQPAQADDGRWRQEFQLD